MEASTLLQRDPIFCQVLESFLKDTGGEGMILAPGILSVFIFLAKRRRKLKVYLGGGGGTSNDPKKVKLGLQLGEMLCAAADDGGTVLYNWGDPDKRDILVPRPSKGYKKGKRLSTSAVAALDRRHNGFRMMLNEEHFLQHNPDAKTLIGVTGSQVTVCCLLEMFMLGHHQVVHRLSRAIKWYHKVILNTLKTTPLVVTVLFDCLDPQFPETLRPDTSLLRPEQLELFRNCIKKMKANMKKLTGEDVEHMRQLEDLVPTEADESDNSPPGEGSPDV